MPWMNLSKFAATDSPHAVRLMTVPQIKRGISVRKFVWRKPTQQIADEAGLNVETINKVLRGEPVSTESYAKLSSYLRTPAGPHALINNRASRATEDSVRRSLTSRLMRLAALAINYDIRTRSRESCAAMTVGELRAYYYRLRIRVREKILLDQRWPDSVRGKFVIPDMLEAWQWVERLDQLRDHPMISASSPSATTRPIAAQRGGLRSRSTAPVSAQSRAR